MKKLSLLKYFTFYSLISNDLVNGKTIKVIKIYLPIEINNSIVGVYEIITPYAEIKMHIKQVIRIISIIVFSGLLILYLLLLKIIYDSSMKMLKQNEALINNSNDYKSTVLALSKAIDARDKYTVGHSERVTQISFKIGQELGLSTDELIILEIAALFHDVGKIGISDQIFIPHNVAVNELIKFKNIQFDQIIVETFLKINIDT